ncbi:MAG: endonuclease III domain-containing protein [Kiritimatiellae bacterium]|nr:endonuclease III domain-containing protein [Kiritimatiellia bacterium]
MYEVLFRAWGPQGWWPGRTRTEIIVGAILTQNTAWSNVEKAIRRLRRERALSLAALHAVPEQRLAEWIRPAGYYNIKARRLRAFTTMVANRFGGRLEKLFALDTPGLRQTLLEVNGIGPETADSILLYAAGRPVFVVDAYTHRILLRHGWIGPQAGYDEIAGLFTSALPRSVRVYNECHALIVRLGKDYCRATPRCDRCPLRPLLPRHR